MPHASRMALAFFAATVAPGVVLGLIAARSLRHEEAYLRNRLEDTLRAEEDQVAASMRRQIAATAAELGRMLPPFSGGDCDAYLRAWKESSPLVGVPFLVSADRRILSPRPGGADASASFIKENRAILTSEEPISTFQNVAELERDSGADAGEEADSGKYRGAQSSPWRRDLALSSFRRSAVLQERLYKKAREEKKRILPRKVQPLREEEAPAATRSMLVLESALFSQITSGAESGFIPRLEGDRLEILFWKRLGPEGPIAGCGVSLPPLTARVLDALPSPWSPIRILTLLDQRGAPLLLTKEMGKRDWKKPFLSQEVSEVLPHWELATYLTDPGSLSAQARARGLIMGLVIAFLLLSLFTGGVLVARAVTHEVRIAQEKTTFAANVSHELKTPLTSIRMFAEMLRRGTPPDPAQRAKYLDLMVAETERLSRLINNVLDFSRIERGEKAYRFRDCDCAEIARRVAASSAANLEQKGFRVSFSAPPRPLPVRADPEAVEQALLNLLSNAEKYSGDGREIEIEAAAAGGNALIAVSDRGRGVPAGREKKIFEKFFRADDGLTAASRGTGLGLSIARAIARDHGGDVLYLPRKGGGSRFEIRFPLAAGHAKGDRE